MKPEREEGETDKEDYGTATPIQLAGLLGTSPKCLCELELGIPPPLDCSFYLPPYSAAEATLSHCRIGVLLQLQPTKDISVTADTPPPQGPEG